jgi:hypothetical protein
LYRTRFQALTTAIKCGIPQYLQAKNDVVPQITTRLLPATILCNVLFTDDIKTV